MNIFVTHISQTLVCFWSALLTILFYHFSSCAHRKMNRFFFCVMTFITKMSNFSKTEYEKHYHFLGCDNGSLEPTISPYHRRSSELYRNAIANTIRTLITSNLEYDFGLGSEASTKNIDCRGLYENEYRNALCDYIIYKSKALTFPNT